MRRSLLLGGLSLLSLTTSTVAFGNPTVRKSYDLHGDFAIIGNTVGIDCRNNNPSFVTAGTVPAMARRPHAWLTGSHGAAYAEVTSANSVTIYLRNMSNAAVNASFAVELR